MNTVQTLMTLFVGVLILDVIGCAANNPIVINDHRMISGRIVMIDQKSEIMTIKSPGGETVTVRISKPDRYYSLELVGKYVDIQLDRSIYLTPVHTASDEQRRIIPVNNKRMMQTARDGKTDHFVFSAFVDKVDFEQKRLYLKDPDGNQVIVQMDERNNDFTRINVSDIVLVQYYDTIVIIERDNEKQTVPDNL